MKHKAAEFRFYEELNDFLPVEKRKRSFVYQFRGRPTVKEAIEAIGVPHAEVDVVLLNGNSVGFEQPLADDDRVAVYPMFESLDVSSVTRLRPAPLRQPRFVLDTHLGTLSRRLRLLGFDAAYRNDYDDAEIIRIAREEGRAILTRDRGILKRNEVVRGYWVRKEKPKEQVLEVLGRFDLFSQIRPFLRCTVCNGDIKQVAKEAVLEPCLTSATGENGFDEQLAE